ncbi:MAG: hypothetical protein WBP26_03800 [Candidatus Saccharimonadales bacterium]
MKLRKTWSRKRKITSIVLLCAATVLLLAVIMFVRWASQPVVQSIPVTVPEPIGDAEDGDAQIVETAYFTTEVPAALRVQKVENKANPLLVQVSVFESKNGGRQLGITANALPAEGMTGVADYNYRSKKTEAYQVTTLPGVPAGSTTFESTSGAREVATFITDGSHYASVVVTGSTATHEQLLALHDQVLRAWQWR